MAGEITRKDMSAGGAGADEDRATDAGDRPRCRKAGIARRQRRPVAWNGRRRVTGVHRCSAEGFAGPANRRSRNRASFSCR